MKFRLTTLFVIVSLCSHGAQLSLTHASDYKIRTPTCTNLIKGIGMGVSGDYHILRAEDIAFLGEAIRERHRRVRFSTSMLIEDDKEDIASQVMPDSFALTSGVISQDSYNDWDDELDLIEDDLGHKGINICILHDYSNCNEDSYWYEGLFIKPGFRLASNDGSYRTTQDFMGGLPFCYTNAYSFIKDGSWSVTNSYPYGIELRKGKVPVIDNITNAYRLVDSGFDAVVQCYEHSFYPTLPKIRYEVASHTHSYGINEIRVDENIPSDVSSPTKRFHIGNWPEYEENIYCTTNEGTGADSEIDVARRTRAMLTDFAARPSWEPGGEPKTNSKFANTKIDYDECRMTLYKTLSPVDPGTNYICSTSIGATNEVIMENIDSIQSTWLIPVALTYTEKINMPTGLTNKYHIVTLEGKDVTSVSNEYRMLVVTSDCVVTNGQWVMSCLTNLPQRISAMIDFGWLSRQDFNIDAHCKSVLVNTTYSVNRYGSYSWSDAGDPYKGDLAGQRMRFVSYSLPKGARIVTVRKYKNHAYVK